MGVMNGGVEPKQDREVDHMVIAVIPARGGSKRIKNKNIKDFCGRPMISYALEYASASGIFDRIHVSTDSEEIKNIVESLGYAVDFMRPEHLANDTVGLMPVLQWILTEYEKRGLSFSDVCCLMPACPLIEPRDLAEAYEIYRSHAGRYPLHVVSSYPVPIEWAYRRDAAGFLTPVSPGAFATRSQDLQPAYYESGPFSFFNVKHIIGENPAGDSGFVSMVLPKFKAVDIDEIEDFEFAELIYRGRHLKDRVGTP